MKPTHTFSIWNEYWGEVIDDESDGLFRTKIYGFENLSVANQSRTHYLIPALGSSFGYVGTGSVSLRDACVEWRLTQGQYFSLPQSFELALLEPNTRLVIAQRVGFHGLYSTGGPIETRGRLKYIDGCSDTLLIAPPVLGDPCQNLLHFPGNIDQTPHTHPSCRSGMIARGGGHCIAEGKRVSLKQGMIFYIPKNTVHQFQTLASPGMDVIAYHPDSDWGPTHQEHPMINRTLVQGLKVDNSIGVHTTAELIEGSPQ